MQTGRRRNDSFYKHFRALPVTALLALIARPPETRAQSLQDLQQMSLDQLADLKVTTAARVPEALSETPASIYVITADDIRRSGAISMEEVLRLAPNLDVAQDNAFTWAISARGFNATTSDNKLLVMIDGRPIYEPVQSGVYWDQLQVPLDDIDRIEVISGPGGTQWGANAVNGVINIITKNADQTLGGLLDVMAGPVDQYGVNQYGGRIGANGAWRIYGMGFGVGNSDLPGGANAHDNWWGGQTGFRTDWQKGADSLTFEGDYDRNANAQDGTNNGEDLEAIWQHVFADGSNLQVQASYDRAVRLQPGYLDQYESYDLQAQHTFSFGRNTVVYGGEFRTIPSLLTNSADVFVLQPAAQTLNVGDAFAEDTLALTGRLKLTFGTKLEATSFAGPYFLPSIRLGWTVDSQTFLWAAVSRAVRSPSRLDREITAPGLLALAPNFAPENLIAYELGYRGRPLPTVSLNVSLYYNIYDDLRSTGISPVTGYLYQLQNGYDGTTYGLESWADWRVLPWWRIVAGANYLHKNLHLKSGFVDIAAGESEGFDPSFEGQLRSSFDLAHHVELDFGIYGVSRLMDAPIDGYVYATGRVAWHPTPQLELSLAGQNLLSPYQAQTVTPGDPTYEVRRSIYLGLRWAY